MNVKIIKRIMLELKITLSCLRNQDGKTVKADTEKINELLTHIRTSNITELNELIYARAKLISDKIGLPKKNTKPGWKIRLETEIFKKSKTTSKNDTTEEKWWNILERKEKSNTSKTNNTTRGNKSEGTEEKKKTKKILRQDKTILTKQGVPKQ